MSPPAISPEERRARQQEYIAVGRVVRPHGVRGVLLVEAISELIHRLEPSSQIFLGEYKRVAEVEYLRPHKDRFLLALDSLEDRDQAEEWRGSELFLRTADSESLPEGIYYHWQIIGLEVETEEGEAMGVIQKILETGANDVYVVEQSGRKELLLPAIDEVIREVDLDGGRMVVRLLPGLRTD